jgi:hypothetical protein
MNQLARAFFQPRDRRGDAPLAQHRRAPLFAAISTGGAAAAPPLKLRKEPRTGLEFPLEYCSRGRDGCAQLEGVGVRAKRCASMSADFRCSLAFAVRAPLADDCAHAHAPPRTRAASRG